LFAIHATFIIALLLVLQVFFDFDSTKLLSSDGYYATSKKVFEGEGSLTQAYRQPGLSILFLVMHFFPSSLHPYLRLALTLAFSFGNIYIAYLIFNQVMGSRAVFYGLLLSLFSPTYIHWTLKSSPETYITFFLGIIVLAYLKFWRTHKKKYIFLLILTLVTSVFIKPVLLFVPLFVALCGFIIKGKRLIIVSILAFLIYAVLFPICLKSQKLEGQLHYGSEAPIETTYLIETILQTKRFDNTPFKEHEMAEAPDTLKAAGAWIANYKKNYRHVNPIHMNMKFIKENFWLYVKTRILSVIFFIFLSDSPKETLLNVFVNLPVVAMSIYSLKQKFSLYRSQIVIILSALLGYAALYLVANPTEDRYSIPAMFYFSVFAGIAVEKAITVLSQKYHSCKHVR